MSVGPKHFEVDYPLPADGEEIMWRAKGTSDWREAVVNFVWLAEDVPCVSLVGGGNFFPKFGDEWKRKTTDRRG